MTTLAVTLAVIYGVAMSVLLVYGLHLLVLASNAARAPRHASLDSAPFPSGDALPQQPLHLSAPETREPVVTIQVPLFNEPAVAARVVDAVASIDHPSDRLEIQILDDSTDGTPAIVAERIAFWRHRGVDIVHLRREVREGFKAGALQAGLTAARGEFIAIFDADFVPAPDFLRRALPAFSSPRVGMVQARWGHLNAETSAVTRVQAFGLDAHFAVEQEGRRRAGAFMSFNGTAGIWRRECIDDAGGWSADTLAEDLDLSYRAQLRGWRFRYVNDLAVPAELPATMPAVRTQQYRWTKGAAESARKLSRRVLREPAQLRQRLMGVLHLTAHVAFPALLLAAIVHAPLMAVRGALPWPLYFGVLSIGLFGFAGFLSTHLVAQRRLHPDWLRRQVVFPLFMLASIGLSVHNTIAFLDGLSGRRTPFVRTPKAGDGIAATHGRIPGVVWLETALAAYSSAGLGLLIASGAWAALPFQTMFVVGFGLVAGRHLMDVRGAGRAVREVATN